MTGENGTAGQSIVIKHRRLFIVDMVSVLVIGQIRPAQHLAAFGIELLRVKVADTVRRLMLLGSSAPARLASELRPYSISPAKISRRRQAIRNGGVG